MKITVSGRITLDGKPLKRLFVEIRKTIFLQDFSAEFCTTDDNGRFKVTFVQPGFPFSFNVNSFNVRIHCHNSAMRVLEAGTPNSTISIDTTMNNRGTLNLDATNTGGFYDHFKMLEQAIDIYDTVWRQFKPYSLTNRRDFPLGREASVRNTFGNSDFVEISYPAFSFNVGGRNLPLAYVEASNPTNSGFPLVQIPDKTADFRLFGINGSHPIMLPHELGHAFHFSALDTSTRIAIEADYVGSIIASLATGGGGTHQVDKVTSPFVAFIEAMGIFSERFYMFSKLVRPNLNGLALRTVFSRDELGPQSLANALQPDVYVNVGKVDASDQISANALRAKDIEGSVYGAVYLHLAKKIGLSSVINFIIVSEATTFDELRDYIVTNGNARQVNAIRLVERVWFT